MTLKNHFNLYSKLKKSWIKNKGESSKYWLEYVVLMTSIIDSKGLEGFGYNYSLTRGFGDVRKIPKSSKLRNFFRFSILYKPLEIFLAFYRYKKNRLVIKKSKPLVWESLYKKLTFISNQISDKTNELGINRCVNVDGKEIPWRYSMSLFYLETIQNIFSRHDSQVTFSKLLAGNFMDIGGGYGVMCDTVNIFKNITDVKNTKTYILEQFPVSYICYQYLNYSYSQKVDIISEEFDFKRNESTSCVIQSCKKSLKDLNVSFFFNSNSFQEMDDKNIKDYVKFMINNSSEESYLGVFLYNSQKSFKRQNTLHYSGPERVNNILKINFSLIGSLTTYEMFKLNSCEMNKNFIDGEMFIYKIN